MAKRLGTADLDHGRSLAFSVSDMKTFRGFWAETGWIYILKAVFLKLYCVYESPRDQVEHAYFDSLRSGMRPEIPKTTLLKP